jgi:hypothetical protein
MPLSHLDDDGAGLDEARTPSPRIRIVVDQRPTAFNERDSRGPMTMGYSSAGVVLPCGAGVQQFKPGGFAAQPVACLALLFLL